GAVVGDPRRTGGVRGPGGSARSWRGEAGEELVARHVDPVAKRLVAEKDLERDDLDPVALAPLVGQVGGGVGDDREAASQQLFDGQDERVVLLAALLDLDLEPWIVRANLRLEPGQLRVARLVRAGHGRQRV